MRIFLVLVVLLLSAPVVAQEKPYSARPADFSTLIKPATYRESPLQLKYTLVETRQVVRGPRLDFEHVYDVPYDTFVKEMTEAYENHQPVSALRPGAIPYLNVRELFVHGVNYTGKDILRFNLGIKDMPLRFSLDVVPDQNRTIVTIHNAFFSELYSGVMPARAGYKPKDARSVPFRWN